MHKYIKTTSIIIQCITNWKWNCYIIKSQKDLCKTTQYMVFFFNKKSASVLEIFAISSYLTVANSASDLVLTVEAAGFTHTHRTH